MSNAPDSSEAAAPGRLDPVIPRYHLPDDWSGKGACPVCRTPGQLRVRRQDGAPDQMVCGACDTAFEVETGGARIRLAVAPPALAKSAGLLDTWLTPSALRVLLAQAPAAQPTFPIEQPTASATAAVVDAMATAQAESGTVEPSLTEPSPAKKATGPPTPNPANGAAEPEPGTEDWFASLAAAIGGLSPVVPPSDDVLADELERALLARPESGSNGTAAAGPDTPAAAAANAADAVTDAATANVTMAAVPDKPPEPTTAAAPGEAPASKALAVTSETVSNGTRGTLPNNSAAPAGAAASETLVAATNVSQAATAVATAIDAPIPPDNATTIVAPATVAPTSNSQTTTTVSAAAPTAPGTGVQAPTPQSVRAGVNAPTPVAGGPSPSRQELAERAWKLHELGNSLPSIQSALESSGGTAEDVTAIMGKLVSLEQARRARFGRNMQFMIGGALVVVLVLLVIAVLVTLNPAPAATPNPAVTIPGSAATVAAQAGTPVPAVTPASNPTAALSYNPLIGLLNQLLPGDVKIANGPSPTPMPSSSLLNGLFPATATLSEAELATAEAKKSSLPAWASTLVPSSLIVVTAPVPSLDPNGPGSSPCPTTSLQASALFGGSPGNWTFTRQQGWIYVLAGSPIAVRVPANMTASYLVIGQNLEIRSVVGPATIHGVNFVSISCS